MLAFVLLSMEPVSPGPVAEDLPGEMLRQITEFIKTVDYIKANPGIKRDPPPTAEALEGDLPSLMQKEIGDFITANHEHLFHHEGKSLSTVNDLFAIFDIPQRPVVGAGVAGSATRARDRILEDQKQERRGALKTAEQLLKDCGGAFSTEEKEHIIAANSDIIKEDFITWIFPGKRGWMPDLIRCFHPRDLSIDTFDIMYPRRTTGLDLLEPLCQWLASSSSLEQLRFYWGDHEVDLSFDGSAMQILDAIERNPRGNIKILDFTGTGITTPVAERLLRMMQERPSLRVILQWTYNSKIEPRILLQIKQLTEERTPREPAVS